MKNDMLLDLTDKNTDVISTIIGVILHEPQAIAHLAELIGSQYITSIQKIPYIQLQKYLNRVKKNRG